MALAIKAIPTLYGDEARRFREMADETERKFDIQFSRGRTSTSKQRWRFLKPDVQRIWCR